MINALDMEAVLLHPRYLEFVEHIRALTPVGVRDQGDAATADAYAVMSTLGSLFPGAESGGWGPTDLPAWLRLSVLDAVASWANGVSSTCVHSPEPTHPQPVLSAAWKPRLVVCALCAPLLAQPRGSVKDRTCDSCGHVCAGPEAGDGIYPAMVQLGPLIHQYGVCTDCRVSVPLEV